MEKKCRQAMALEVVDATAVTTRKKPSAAGVRDRADFSRTPSSRVITGYEIGRVSRPASSPIAIADDGTMVTPRPALAIPAAVDMYVASKAGVTSRPIEAKAPSTSFRTLLSVAMRIRGNLSS